MNTFDPAANANVLVEALPISKNITDRLLSSNTAATQ